MTPQNQEYIFDEESAHISRNEQEEINADAENAKTLYRFIPLTQGQVTEVDAEDFARASAFKWCAWWSPECKKFYAVRWTRKGKERHQYGLHRFILNLAPDDSRRVDHRDRNPLNNRKENLRIATPLQNVANRTADRDNKCGFKGVHQIRPGKFRSSIRFHGKLYHLGYHPTPELAHEAYYIAALKFFGEFACH